MSGWAWRRSAALTASAALAVSLLAVPASAEEEPTAAPAGAGLPSEGTTDQIIITTVPGVSDGAIERITEETAAELGTDLAADVARDISPATSVVRLDDPLPLDDAARLADELSETAEVRRAEPDVIMRPMTSLPNDPYASSLWGLWQTSIADGGWSTRAIPAWSTTRGTGVTVAVLDTGIASHPDLDANVVPGYDFISYTWVSNDGDGRDPDASDPGDYDPPYDPYSTWHGTHVAGTIAAVADNGTGVAGVAPEAQLQSVRVLGAGGGYTSDIADAIMWASGASIGGVPDNPTPARVINLSLGGVGFCYPAMQSAIDVAVAQGSVVVVAAGNDDMDAVYFSPASCDDVVTVASHTSTGAKSGFSNYGPYVEVSGPGSGIRSTIDLGDTIPVGPGYGYYSGTSMAAPHVAGVAALVLSADPTLTSPEVSDILQSTSQPFTSSSGAHLCGYGYVDAASAVSSLGALDPTDLCLTSDVEALEVAWAAPPAPAPGVTVTHYDVEYSTDGAAWTVDDSVTADNATMAVMSARLEGLNSTDSYLVRVRSVTADDSSAWVISTPATPLVRVSPPPTPPPPPPPPPPPAPVVTAPGAPTITGVVASDEGALVQWEPSAITGGAPPSSFSIELEGPTGTITESTSDASYAFEGLVNGSTYRVRVAATNTAGTGDFSPWSDPLTPLGLASAPQAVTGTALDSAVTLRWSEPSDGGGAPIEGYVVQWTADGIEVQLPSPMTSLRIPGLTNGSRYVFRVAARTAAGIGEWSDPLTLAPRAAPVSAPRDVSIELRGRKLRVSWATPAVGDPVRYIVATSVNGRSFRVKGSTRDTSLNIPLTARTSTIAVRVLAVDSYGRGPWSGIKSLRFGRQR